MSQANIPTVNKIIPKKVAKSKSYASYRESPARDLHRALTAGRDRPAFVAE